MNEESETNLSLISHPRIQNINQSEKQTEWPISDQNITSQVWRYEDQKNCPIDNQVNSSDISRPRIKKPDQ